MWCTDQYLAFLYLEEISAACALVLALFVYLFYVRYPYDKDKPEDADERPA